MGTGVQIRASVTAVRCLQLVFAFGFDCFRNGFSRSSITGVERFYKGLACWTRERPSHLKAA